ncbi:hypothetical protein [Rubinisphaera italica]|uniref:Uncharacterized protein n=1 Tax=Rubinisphaera italica TaxID=2527969 RepID=A0A5C5XG30_9PLAN|nr:hypothetical protein [Rubinisphaera italica]TWT61351.1 hypothetical protein Pan54_20870 [Rubinisphaera italica]
MKFHTTKMMIAATVLSFGFLGCTPQPGTEGTNTTESESGHDDHDDHDHGDHAHPSEGPHHGSLIELGNEEYHAELVHDDAAGTVTIYVLNASATEAEPIEATEVTINVKHDGTPEQFKLAATPDANDPEGKSSKFVSSDAELATHLDEEGAAPTLVLMINGKSFRGTVTHDHDDHDHDHAH